MNSNLVNLDGMYYRNQAIIDSQTKCSKYKTIRTYSGCSEDQVKKTVVVEEKPSAPAKPASKPASK